MIGGRAVAAAALVLTACSVERRETHTTEHAETVEITPTPLADGARVERELAATWRVDVGPIRDLRCPAAIPRRAGVRFRCTMTIGDAPAVAAVTILTVDDDRATWKYEFEGEWFMAPQEARIVAQTLGAKLGAEPTVDCGASRRFGLDDSPTCSVLAADGRRATARFGRQPDGQVVWRIED